MKKCILLFGVIFLITQNSSSQKYISGFGASVGTNILISETKLTESALSPNLAIHGLLNLSEKTSLKLQSGYGQFGIDNKNLKLTTSFIPIELIAMFSPIGRSAVSPFFHFGLGAISFSQSGSRYYDGLFIGGGGIKADINNQFSFLVSADLRYTTSDQFNGIIKGFYDGYLNIQIGLTYNLHPKLFERKSKLKRESIIASAAKSDSILELIEIQSKIDLLKKEILIKDGQLKQLMSQIQSRQDRINKIATEIASLDGMKSDINRLSRTQEIAVNKTPTAAQLSNSQIEIKYEETQAMIQSKQFDRAISELEILLQRTINHPLKSNFIYWIGECYFAKGKYSEAIDSFEQISNFKASYKLDDALIMCGISFMKLGDFQNARKKFRDLIQKYPDSEYVSKASKYLQTVERQIIS